jgi:hypothetical protein
MWLAILFRRARCHAVELCIGRVGWEKTMLRKILTTSSKHARIEERRRKSMLQYFIAEWM